LPSKQLNKEGESDLAFFFAGWAESAKPNVKAIKLDWVSQTQPNYIERLN